MFSPSKNLGYYIEKILHDREDHHQVNGVRSGSGGGGTGISGGDTAGGGGGGGGGVPCRRRGRLVVHPRRLRAVGVEPGGDPHAHVQDPHVPPHAEEAALTSCELEREGEREREEGGVGGGEERERGIGRYLYGARPGLVSALLGPFFAGSSSTSFLGVDEFNDEGMRIP